MIENTLESLPSIHIYETLDGSPSLFFSGGEFPAELMHSNQGAFSETVYIYCPIIDAVLETQAPPVFLSIGLGLGYVELLVCARLLQKQPDMLLSPEFYIYSFEKEKFLVNNFRNYFTGGEIDNDLSKIYADIVKRTAEHFSLSAEKLSAAMADLFERDRLLLRGAFHRQTMLSTQVSGIFFDAFSIKASPDMWESETLDNLLAPCHCAPMAFFATYASRRTLREKLEHIGFHVIKRKGFAGKRECIAAVRGTTEQLSSWFS